MTSSAFILFVCAFAFLFAFKDAQGLDQTKSAKVPSLFHHISRARKANLPNEIITAREAETKCEKLRAEALAKIKEGAIFVLVPDCRADGSFNPVQCDQRFSVNFAICWCVDKDGKKTPVTEVTIGFGQDKPPSCDDKSPAKRHRLTGHRKTKLV